MNAAFFAPPPSANELRVFPIGGTPKRFDACHCRERRIFMVVRGSPGAATLILVV
jgi:hypothetical protein